MSQNETIALSILDNVSLSTLNDIAGDLAARGKVECLRALHELKGGVPFVKPKNAPPGYSHHDPFEKAAEANQLNSVQTLLELGLKPVVKKPEGSGVTHYCNALKDSVENIIDAIKYNKGEQAIKSATDVAVELYKSVRTSMPANFVLHFWYDDSSSGFAKGKPPAWFLGENLHPATKDRWGGAKEKPKNTLLAHCVSNEIDRLKEEIISYVESTDAQSFTDRDAQILLAAHDLGSFSRVVRHTAEVSVDTLKRILQLPAELQSQAIEIIRDKKLPAAAFDDLIKLTKSMAPETMNFVLSKIGKELGGDMVSSLLVHATRANNLPLMRELLSVGERMPDWNIDRAVAGSVSTGYTYHYIAIHQCESADAVRLLTERGADIECRDKDGKTPLQKAVGKNETPEAVAVVSALIDAGADIGVRHLGRTLIQLAGAKSEKIKVAIRSAKTAVTVESALDAGVDGAQAASRRKPGFSPL